jgi:type VI secretion system protein ImpE
VVPGTAAGAEETMTATELYRAGRLADAVAAQLADVKANPADHGRRLFLFELSAFAGDWDRARRQLDVVKYDNPEQETSTSGYRALLDAEDARTRVFRDAVLPEFLIPPPQWVFARLEAVAALKAGKAADAAARVAESDAAAGVVSGVLNGNPVVGLRDADDLFGPVIEVMAKGVYYWVPLEQVDSLAANAPRFPRDLVWFPVKLSVRGGPEGDAFLPTRYPGTTAAADEALKLARATDWPDPGDGPVRGLGVRLLAAGEDAVAITELREWVAG